MAKKRAPKPPPSSRKVLETIQAIKEDLKKGDSLALSRKIRCGSSNSMLYKAVSTHPDYQPILLKYGKQKGLKNQYTNRAEKIVKGETPNFYAWVIQTRGPRLYAIHKVNTELIGDPLKDLFVTTDDETGKLQLTSRAFTKSIYFTTKEMLEEFNKAHLEGKECNHG